MRCVIGGDRNTVDLYSLCRTGCFITRNNGSVGFGCTSCPIASSCSAGSVAPCACKPYYYQDEPGQPVCKRCPLPATLDFAASSCSSQASTSTDLPVYFYLLAAVFACIAVQAVVLAARLLRSRHSSSLRTVRAGMCLYVAMFVPYAVLQATTLGKLAKLSDSSLDRDAAQISSSAAFAAFFGLGFSGKVALVQLWTHVVRQHTSGGCEAPHRLHTTLMSTYKAFVWAVVAIVAVYVTGFAALTSMYMASVQQCNRLQTEKCISLENLQQPCSESATWTRVLEYYEGIWAGVVLVVFTLLAFLFNGVVFAMCVSPVMRWVVVASDVQQVDGRARTFQAAAHACALGFVALAGAAAAAQGLGCRQFPDGGAGGGAARGAAEAGHAVGGAEHRQLPVQVRVVGCRFLWARPNRAERIRYFSRHRVDGAGCALLPHPAAVAPVPLRRRRQQPRLHHAVVVTAPRRCDGGSLTRQRGCGKSINVTSRSESAS
jgi:hypothetical protein